jgi:hypothetical protein
MAAPRHEPSCRVSGNTMAMYADEKLLKGSVIEPYARRKARGADKRAEGIARKREELAAVYAAQKLAVPMYLTPKTLPQPESFIPYQIKRQRGSTGRRDAVRVTTIRGSRIGRPPSAALAAAKAAGHRTYQGRPCPHGHSGLRFVIQNVCVECARLRREAAKSRRLRGGHHHG